MKKILLFLVLSFVFLAAGDNPYENYIKKYSKVAVSEMKRTGVPASITLAQGLLESAAGQSVLSVKGNNHFGIKCHNNWEGGKIKYDAEIRNECFRAYKNAEESFRDHSDFLRYQNRYKSLFDLNPRDYKGWAEGLRKAGYATDPKYPQKLIKLIEEYGLYKYDGKTEVAVESPTVIEAPKPAPSGFRESISISLSRPVFVQNGVPFVYSVEGESYRDIAESNGLFTSELLRFNDVRADAALAGGIPVYLAAKKNVAASGVDKYIAGPDENASLWEISQKYGVKLSALCRMNRMSADYVLSEGDVLVLRK